MPVTTLYTSSMFTASALFSYVPRVAFEAVDSNIGNLREEPQRIATVAASDLQQQRVVTPHELMNLGLRECSSVMVTLYQPPRTARQARNQVCRRDALKAESGLTAFEAR
jgi:hypothetical protein